MYFYMYCLSLFNNGNNKLINEIFYYMYLFVLYIDKFIFIVGCVILVFIVMSIIIGLVYFGWICNMIFCIIIENCFVKCYRYVIFGKIYIFLLYIKNKVKIIY